MIDFERASRFWELNGKYILESLKVNGVMLLDIDAEATMFDKKKERAKTALFQIGFPSKNYFDGIHFFQYRYRNADNQTKTKWLSGERWLKKKQVLIACCGWTFLPVRIEPSKNSVKPEDQRYVYLMSVWKYAEIEKATVAYIAEVTTSWDGTIVKQNKIEGVDLPGFPYKFAFPKRMVSKTNRCLAQSYWPALWGGENYFAWHEIGGGLVQYMGTRHVCTELYVDSLQMMLKEDASGSAATLLSFTCFSVLKRFFTEYHALEKSSPYLEAKKYIPEQIALCVRSESMYFAERIAKLCCGCFYRNTGSKLLVIDGIAVQKSESRIAKLSVNEFERKVLQPASVLWVNRKPEDALLEDGRVISMQVGDDAKHTMVGFFSSALLADLADRVENKRSEQYQDFLKKEWRLADSSLQTFIDEVRSEAERFHYNFDDLNLQMEYDEICRMKNLPRPIGVLEYFWQRIRKDCRERLEYCKDVITRNHVHVFERKANEKYKKCKNQFLKQNKLLQKEVFSFDSYYSTAWEDLKAYSSDVSRRSVRKFALLTASADVFVDLCIPEQQRSEIQDGLHRGLRKILLLQKKEWRATDIIEQYVLQELSEGRCARMRGTGSEREDITLWYDAEQKYFLLPAKHYFDGLKQFLPDAAISKTEFENKLADEQSIRVESGKTQLNRTFKVRVVRDYKGPGPSMLAVRSENFSKTFFENQGIQLALSKMVNDSTPLRSPS